MTKTYALDARTDEISLAIEAFLIAPAAVSAPTFAGVGNKVNFTSPPAGFISMGNVVPDSPTIRMTREKYQLEFGIPRVLQYEQIMSVGAEISFSIYSNSFFQAQFALGNTAITTVSTVDTSTFATQYLGKSTITEYYLLGVADFINGSQVVHEFPSVRASDEWEETFRPDEASQINITFTAKAYTTWIDSCSHLVVGERHYFGPGGLCTS